MAIPPSRLHYLDHLRVSLVILVIIHHLALVYGASAPFYYVEPPPITQFRVFQGFLVFALINQSFFMGALFLLAGYFTPGSYDRKGAASFLKIQASALWYPPGCVSLHSQSRFGAWILSHAGLSQRARRITCIARLPGLQRTRTALVRSDVADIQHRVFGVAGFVKETFASAEGP